MFRYFALSLTVLASSISTSVFAEDCGADPSLSLKLERTGHLSVGLSINGRPVRMLVDTGANVNTLDKEWAPKLGAQVKGGEGVRVGEGRAELAVEAAGRKLGLQEFAVMDLHFINIPSQRYGTEPFAGQLGAAFFSRYKAKIFFGSNVMCLSLSE